MAKLEATINVEGLDEVKELVDGLRGHIDLMADEFARIRSLVRCNVPSRMAVGVGDEIEQLCVRAVEVCKQRVPLIEQRDAVQAKLDRVRCALYDAIDLAK